MAISRRTHRELDIAFTSLKTCLAMRGADVEGWYLEEYKPGDGRIRWRVGGPKGSHPMGLAFYYTAEMIGALRLACYSVQAMPIPKGESWRQKVQLQNGRALYSPYHLHFQDDPDSCTELCE